jgi:hypothetical protein
MVSSRPLHSLPVNDATVWCPSCGAAYVTGSTQCPDCRVALVNEPPVELGALVELGEWPKLQAQILRRRLETAGVPVMIDWSSDGDERTGVLLVPEQQSDFANAVVTEIDVDDEVNDDSPHAYVVRIEEHLSAAAGLLDELRTRLDELESNGRS